MDKLQKDKVRIAKMKSLVRDQMPGFADRFFNANIGVKKPSTLEAYARDMVLFFRYLDSIGIDSMSMTMKDLNRINSSIVEDFLEQSRNDYEGGKEKSDAAIARLHGSLSSFFMYYYRNNFIDSNPVIKVITPQYRRQYLIKEAPSNDLNTKLLDFVSSGQLPGSHAAAYQENTRSRDRAILMLIIGAGIKASECVEINIEDVDIENKFVTIHKNNSDRIVYISDQIAVAISSYLKERLETIPYKGSDTALFLSLQGKRLCLRAVEKMIKKYTTALFGDSADAKITSVDLVMSFRNNIFDSCSSRKSFATISSYHQDDAFDIYKGYIEEYERYKARDFKS